MMMGLTPERRKELRELARQHNEKQENRTVATVTPEVHVNTPGRRKHSRRLPPHLPLPLLHRKRWRLPFFPTSNRKAEGGSRGPYAACLPPHAGDAPARRSLVTDWGRHNIGLSEGHHTIRGYIQPLDLKGYQKEKALQYVLLRDAYERLYRYESNLHEANVQWREHLNTCYDEFVMRYGNLNAKQNVKLVMMDAGGRDILSLERVKNGSLSRRTSSSVPFPSRWRAMQRRLS